MPGVTTGNYRLFTRDGMMLSYGEDGGTTPSCAVRHTFKTPPHKIGCVNAIDWREGHSTLPEVKEEVDCGVRGRRGHDHRPVARLGLADLLVRWLARRRILYTMGTEAPLVVVRSALGTCLRLGVDVPFPTDRYYHVLRRMVDNWRKRIVGETAVVAQFRNTYRRQHVRALAAYITSRQGYWEPYVAHSQREYSFIVLLFFLNFCNKIIFVYII